MDQFMPEAIAATVFALGVLIYKKFKEAFMAWLIDYLTVHQQAPNKRDINNQEAISKKIVSITSSCLADRCFIFEFHNGNTFSSNQPVFRMSCTYEHCKDGIAYQSSQLQNVITSLVLEIIKPLFGDGVSKGVGCMTCKNCHGTVKCPLKGVYRYKVREMSEGYSKAILLMQGINEMLLTPILNRNGTGLIGFMGVVFCNEEVELPDDYTVLCREATTVGFILEQRKH